MPAEGALINHSLVMPKYGISHHFATRKSFHLTLQSSKAMTRGFEVSRTRKGVCIRTTTENPLKISLETHLCPLSLPTAGLSPTSTSPFLICKSPRCQNDLRPAELLLTALVFLGLRYLRSLTPDEPNTATHTSNPTGISTPLSVLLATTQTI